MPTEAPDPASIVPAVVSATEFKPYKALIIAVSFVTLALVIGIILFLLLQGRFTPVTDTNSQTSTETTAERTAVGVLSADSSAAATGTKWTLFMPQSPKSLEPDSMGNLQLGELIRVTDRKDVATFLTEQFIKGPTVEEAAQGFYVPRADENASTQGLVLTGDSSCAGKDFTINIVEKVATLQFCRTVMGIGTIADGLILTALKQNISQFDTVDKVIVLDDNGDCLFDMSGMNVCLN